MIQFERSGLEQSWIPLAMWSFQIAAIMALTDSSGPLTTNCAAEQSSTHSNIQGFLKVSSYQFCVLCLVLGLAFTKHSDEKKLVSHFFEPWILVTPHPVIVCFFFTHALSLCLSLLLKCLLFTQSSLASYSAFLNVIFFFSASLLLGSDAFRDKDDLSERWWQEVKPEGHKLVRGGRGLIRQVPRSRVSVFVSAIADSWAPLFFVISAQTRFPLATTASSERTLDVKDILYEITEERRAAA